MKAEDLGIIMEGAHLAGLMPYLKDFIERMERTLENRVLTALESGELTEEMAMYAWMEKMAYRKLLKKFEQSVRIGAAVGEKHTPEMNQLQGQRHAETLPNT